MWPFKRKEQKPLLAFDGKARHDELFGKGSWDELERGVMERLQKRDPYLYSIIKDMKA